MKQDTKDKINIFTAFALLLLLGGLVLLAIAQANNERRANIQECIDTAINRCAELECEQTYKGVIDLKENNSETKELAQCRARGGQ